MEAYNPAPKKSKRPNKPTSPPPKKEYCRRCADPYLDCSEHGIKSFDELLNKHALRMIKIGTYDKISATNLCKEIMNLNKGLSYLDSCGMKPVEDITSCKTIKSKVGTQVRLWEVFIMIKGA